MTDTATIFKFPAPPAGEVIRELLHYSPDTGIFTWRERARRWFRSDRDFRAWNARYAGERAGAIWTNHETGYQARVIRLLGRRHKEHRVAWMWMTDEPLPPEIDHENRDATDNRWMNLRASTHANNGRNQSMSRNNTSGVTGVRWHKATGKWQAQCKVSGIPHHLGLFRDLCEAARVVAEFRAANGFDPSHGSELACYHGKGASS